MTARNVEATGRKRPPARPAGRLDTPARAAVYVRISDDKRADEAGVTRQREDCEALARARSYELVGDAYVDNDLSASSGVPRPAYAALMRDVAAGRIDTIVVWQTSRLWRNRRERAEGIEALRAVGVDVKAVRGPDLDMSTAYGRGMAGLLGEFDTMESEVKSERVVRALEQNAAAGRPHGRKAYGWDRVYDSETGRSREVINEAEAAVVREIAARIIQGDSIRSLVADLNARAIPSPTGREWAKNTLRHVVLRERNAGLRVHRGEVIGDGAWPPILERGRWDQVRAVLADPTRKTSTSSTATHLLSGIARCGVCGATMRAGRNRSVLSYRCSEKSCVSRRRDDVDDLVERVILGRLAMPDAAHIGRPAEAEDSAAAAATQVATLRARLDLAADEYADGVIDRRQLARITERLRPKIDIAERAASQVHAAPLLDGVAGRADVAARWAELPLTRRRAIVDVLVSVRVLRSNQGARVFDPRSVEITWKN